MALNTLTFNSSQTWTVPAGLSVIDTVFVVGGGGSGGTNRGGGGAGGQVVLTTNVVVGATVTVTVGGSNQASAFGSVTAAAGAAGASNAGAGGATSSVLKGVTANYYGGAAYGYTPPGPIAARYDGGGGAGAGQSGYNAGNYPGRGGDGYRWPTTGTYYGGGGGGGADSTTTTGIANVSAPAAQGGGGVGAISGGGGAGGANLGGGGGGGGDSAGGGVGGTGVVIIQYFDPVYTLSLNQPGVSEGEILTVTLKTQYVTNGSVISFTLSGGSVTGSDFAGGLTGSITITSTDGGITGSGSTTITLVNDSTTEGNEVVVLSLTNGRASVTFLVGDSSIGNISNVLSKTISQSDYNLIRAKVVGVLGPGVGNSGWGQTIQSSAVAEGNTVSIKEWSKLKYDIFNSWLHLYNTTPSLTAISEGNLVRANAINSPYSQYDSYANVIVSNRMNSPGTGQYITRSTPPAPRTEVWVANYNTPWATKLSTIVSASWSNGDAARYFFNSGGELRFTTSRTGGTGSTQNLSWTTLLQNVGTVRFGGAIPGGVVSSGVGNFYSLTNTFQTFFTVASSNPYSNNSFKMSARTPGVNNVNGGATSLEIQVEWLDDHLGIAGGPDSIDGITQLVVSTLEASGLLQPSGTGNFTVECPVISTFTILNG
jgi:hypothetical protein